MAVVTRSEHKPDPEIAMIVHEEVDRLPQRERLPVVLCDLEGLTYEEAAGRLRWTEPTLRHRLVKARGRLRARLTRRGVTAGAMAAIMAQSVSGASAAVPIALAHSAVAAATRGAVSSVVATLSAGMIRSLLLTKIKTATVGILAVITLASASVRLVAMAVARDDPPAPAKPGPTKVVVTVIGPLPQAPQPAAQPEAGPTEPIEGRIVNSKGGPVAGARIEIRQVWSVPDHDLGRWLERARDRGVAHPTDGLLPGNLVARPREPAPPANPNAAQEERIATTGADGRFQLAGVGPDQIAQVRIAGPTIATTQIYVMGRIWAEVRQPRVSGSRRARWSTTPAGSNMPPRRASRLRAWSAIKIPAGRSPESSSRAQCSTNTA